MNRRQESLLFDLKINLGVINMAFTLEDSIVNRKNSADAVKCVIKLLDHVNEHPQSFPSQESKITDREAIFNIFQCVKIMCAIGLGPIMHQSFDVISEEQEKLGRCITQEEADIIIKRVFQEYKPKENITNNIISKEDIIPKEIIPKM